MLFNSLQFSIFLSVIFIVYWMLNKKSLQWQNILLLSASYFFYAFWDWRFLFLLVFSTLIGYLSGLLTNKRKSKIYFWIGIVLQLGTLGIFKYYNFFVLTISESILHLDAHTSPWILHVILPVGISFYIFHGLSYMIDVYKDRIDAEKNIFDYALFVSFFPLLVAGPIERATHLLPQIKRKRDFDYTKAVDGLRQMLWGLFKKIVIADQCAKYVDLIFNKPESYTPSTLIFAAVLFAFQIYGDFSGYSDIAIGTAKLFGFELLRNFAFPYFSRDISEFWRRWHISLSSWFKDYLYIPLGGSRKGLWFTIRNIFIIFFVCGFWHGANWTFIVWGLINAVFMLPSVIMRSNRKHLEIVAKGKKYPTLSEFSSIIVTFTLSTFAWIFFRSENLSAATKYIYLIFRRSKDSYSSLPTKNLIIFITLFVCIEWLGREYEHALQNLGLKWSKYMRIIFYYILIVIIFFYIGSKQQFIYFQF